MVRNTLTLTRESENIRKLVENGWTLKQIGKKYNIPEVTVHLNLYEIIKLSVSRGEFGYKKEEDFQTEEEMLKPIKYTFNNLSDDEKKSITSEKKLAALVGILPVMMDFMEDIRDTYPQLYKRLIKKSGNEFIAEVEKLGNTIYSKIEQENDKEVEDFYQEVVHMGNTFRSWLTEL